MSEMKKMNPEQMEEVSGGTYQGRLTRNEIAAVEFCIKLTKKLGKPFDSYVEWLNNWADTDELKEAAKTYARTFWDRL